MKLVWKQGVASGAGVMPRQHRWRGYRTTRKPLHLTTTSDYAKEGKRS